jgi:hypothetical protein
MNASIAMENGAANATLSLGAAIGQGCVKNKAISKGAPRLPGSAKGRNRTSDLKSRRAMGIWDETNPEEARHVQF